MNYEIPEWAEDPADFTLEVIKNGVFVESVPLLKSCYVFGRAPDCDIVLEHPSCSRYHAVLQCGKGGKWFVYDLKSAHGTFVNKAQISSREYVDVSPGFFVKFGFSSRSYVLENKSSDSAEELEDPLPVVAIHSVVKKAPVEKKVLSEDEEESEDGADIDLDVNELKRKYEFESDESDGDFYDKTKAAATEHVFTEKSLQAKKEELSEKLKELKASLDLLTSNKTSGVAEQEQEEDELESYMAALDRTIKVDAEKATQDQIATTEKELARIEKLITITNR